MRFPKSAAWLKKGQQSGSLYSSSFMTALHNESPALAAQLANSGAAYTFENLDYDVQRGIIDYSGNNWHSGFEPMLVDAGGRKHLYMPEAQGSFVETNAKVVTGDADQEHWISEFEVVGLSFEEVNTRSLSSSVLGIAGRGWHFRLRWMETDGGKFWIRRYRNVGAGNDESIAEIAAPEWGAHRGRVALRASLTNDCSDLELFYTFDQLTTGDPLNDANWTQIGAKTAFTGAGLAYGTSPIEPYLGVDSSSVTPPNQNFYRAVVYEDGTSASDIVCDLYPDRDNYSVSATGTSAWTDGTGVVWDRNVPTVGSGEPDFSTGYPIFSGASQSILLPFSTPDNPHFFAGEMFNHGFASTRTLGSSRPTSSVIRSELRVNTSFRTMALMDDGPNQVLPTVQVEYPSLTDT